MIACFLFLSLFPFFFFLSRFFGGLPVKVFFSRCANPFVCVWFSVAASPYLLRPTPHTHGSSSSSSSLYKHNAQYIYCTYIAAVGQHHQFVDRCGAGACHLRVCRPATVCPRNYLHHSIRDSLSLSLLPPLFAHKNSSFSYLHEIKENRYRHHDSLVLRLG